MTEGSDPAGVPRPSRHPAVRRRVRQAILVSIVLVVPVFREIVIRREARALFAPFIEGRISRQVGGERNSPDELAALRRLDAAPKRLRKAFFDVIFSDPDHQNRFLANQRSILKATFGQHPDGRELLVKIVDQHCYRSGEVDFYRVCWYLIHQLPHLGRSGRRLPCELAETIADRIIETLAAQEPGRWDYLSRYLSALDEKLPAGTREKAAERLVASALDSGEPFGPQELTSLSRALENLGEELSGRAADRAVERALASLDAELDTGAVPTSSEVGALLHVSPALAAQGEKLGAEAAGEAAERVVDVILATRDTALVYRLCPALGTLGGRLSADAAEEAVARMVGRILGTGDVNQLDFRWQALRALGEALSGEAAERAAGPIVEGIAAARDLNQLVFLSRALETFRERFPPGVSNPRTP